MIRRLLALLLFLPISLLTSCVEGEEEIWINKDSSGRVVAHYEIPARALSKLGDPDDYIKALEIIDEKEDLIEITDLSFEVKSGKAIFHLEADFEDARELLSIVIKNEQVFAEEAQADPDHLNGIIGDIDFRLDGITPAFDRVVSPSKIFPPFVARRPKMLGSATFKYTLHLPEKIKESNAHSVSNDGKTVSWTFKLSDHFEKPMEMTLRTGLPIPWWAWLLVIALLVAPAWLILKFKKRKKA